MSTDPTARAAALGLDLARIQSLLAPGEYIVNFEVRVEQGTRPAEGGLAFVEFWSAEVEVATAEGAHGDARSEGVTRGEAIDSLYRLLGARIGR